MLDRIKNMMDYEAKVRTMYLVSLYKWVPIVVMCKLMFCGFVLITGASTRRYPAAFHRGEVYTSELERVMYHRHTIELDFDVEYADLAYEKCRAEHLQAAIGDSLFFFFKQKTAYEI